MQDELVDVVNEANQVIGQIGKQVAHEQGLLHRTVISELIDTRGNWTLVKQAGDRQDPGQYVSPVGGHVRAGETEIEALFRETEEEIGLAQFEYKKVGQSVFNRFVNNHQENHLFIVYEIYSDQTPVLNHESVGFKTFTKEDLVEAIKNTPDIFGTAFHYVWNRFYSTTL